MAIDSRNTFVYSPADLVTLTASQSGATAVSASTAAAGASISWVAKRLQVTMAASGAQPSLTVNICSSSQTSGGILASYKISPPSAVSAGGNSAFSALDLDNLHVLSGANTAFSVGSAAPGASTDVSLVCQIYRLGKANPVGLANAS